MRFFSLAASALTAIVATMASVQAASDAPKGPKITNIVYFDIEVSSTMCCKDAMLAVMLMLLPYRLSVSAPLSLSFPRLRCPALRACLVLLLDLHVSFVHAL
jgi:hypothetical protein